MTEVPPKWANAAQSLKYDMLVSLGTGNVINLSSPTHSALTLALRDIAYDQHIEQGESLKITYRDLSRASPHFSNDSVASGARVGKMRVRADFVGRRRVETLRGRQNRADS